METVARAGELFPAMESAGAEAADLLPLLRERKPPAKSLPGVSRREAREARRKRHAEQTAEIRRKVFERAGNRCENAPFGQWRCPREATELHHLFGGLGRRRQYQSIENTRAYCFECHRAAHRASKRANGGTT